MKTYTKHLWLNTKERIEFVNITDDIQGCVDESGIKEGLVLVNAMHITSSVFINDNESGLINDVKNRPRTNVRNQRFLSTVKNVVHF